MYQYTGKKRDKPYFIPPPGAEQPRDPWGGEMSFAVMLAVMFVLGRLAGC